MKLTEEELDEFMTLFEADGWQVPREEAREGVMRLLSLYEFLLRPTAAEMEALRLDDSGGRGNVKPESDRTPSSPQ